MNYHLRSLSPVRLFACLAVLGWMQSGEGAHAAVILDDFLTDSVNDSFLVAAVPDGAAQTGSLDSGSVVGGTRAYSLQAFDGVPALRARALFTENPMLSAGVLFGASLSNDVGVRSTLSLTYDAGGTGLGLDLSDQDELQLLLNVDFTVGGPEGTMITFEVIDSSTKHHMHPVSFSSSFENQILDARAPLADFAAAGVDLTDIDTIILTYQAPRNDDARWLSFQAIPEPGSLALAALSLACLHSLHRQ